jgi:hypothetical protein
MSDTREGFAEAAETFANFAKEAVYVAIGFGVLEFQKAQVRRQELASARKQELACARKAVNKRAKDFDAALAQVIRVVDSTLEPVLERLPEPAQAIIRQARETRDELRTRAFGFSA